MAIESDYISRNNNFELFGMKPLLQNNCRSYTKTPAVVLQ